MAVQTTYPGVYVQEVPSGVRTIAGVSTSIAVFIGRARKGPLLKPNRCLNFSDFERVFSSEDPRGNSLSDIDMARSVRLFFQNGGKDCYVIRIANGAAVATANLANTNATNVIAVSAKSPGSIGNTIRLSVDHNTRLPDSLFNLEVFRWVPNKNGQMIRTEIEKWPNLSMDPLSRQYAIKVVNEGSRLIDIAALPGATPTNSYSQSALPVSNQTPLDFWQNWKELLMGSGHASSLQWTGTSAIASGGTYTGNTDKTYQFQIIRGGTIGTDSIDITWNDGAGNTGTINFPVGFTAGTTVAISEGITIAPGAGTLVAPESFSVPVTLSFSPAVPIAFTGSSTVTASGIYTGGADKTYTFTIGAANGTINTDPIDINWNDGTGNTGTINIPVAYVINDPILIAEGLSLAFSGGTLIAGESFSVSVAVINPTATNASTATVTASGFYTGTVNKTYTFTVGAADGTINTDAIDINWDDGTGNIGTINIPVAYLLNNPILIADGLSLSFSAGTLVANKSFRVNLHQRASRFRISVNKGLSYEEVNLEDIDFDNDPNFNDTAGGAQTNVGPAIQTRINNALATTGATVNVTMEPDGTSLLLRITSTTHDVQVVPATTNDLAHLIQLGAAYGGVETSLYSDASPADINLVDFGTTGQDGLTTGLTEYDEAFTILDKEVDLFNLMVLPHDREHSIETRDSLWGPASVFCQKKRAFLLIDPPESWRDVQGATDLANGVNRFRIGLVKDHSAIFYPSLIIKENENNVVVGPSGAIAGLMARIDANRGVWKAAAGTEADLRGITGIRYRFSDEENGVLNPQAINTIRVFPNGIVNWGARTMDGDDDFASEWKYIPVRRTALFIEESLYRGLKWVVFEPNDEPLWAQIRLNVGAFMHNLFRQGAFQGTKKNDAYFVKCDNETTTQNDINLGIVNIWVGFAPLKPAEFVILYLQQIVGNIQV